MRPLNSEHQNHENNDTFDNATMLFYWYYYSPKNIQGEVIVVDCWLFSVVTLKTVMARPIKYF